MTNTKTVLRLALLALLSAGCPKMATYTIVHDLMSGFPSAPSGTATFYLPSTLTPIVIYGDASGTATSNPVTLDVNGAAQVWLSQLARMIVQTNGGVTVSDSVINQTADLAVASSSAGFTAMTLEGIGDAALAKFGGQDFQYVPSGSWVGMTPQAWMNGVLRNVMAYGSVGAVTVNDGVTPADTAIDAAIADVNAAGGGVVYLPPGTYLLNAAHNLAKGSIEIRGAGAATILKNNSGSNNVFTTTTGQSNLIWRNLHITATTTSTGTAITATAATNVILDNVIIDSHDNCVVGATSGSQFYFTGNCQFTANSANNGARAIKLTGVTQVTIVGGGYLGKEYDLELLGASGDVNVFGGIFTGANAAVRFDAAISGTNYNFYGNVGSGTVFFSIGAATFPVLFRQDGNGVLGSQINTTTGNTVTPDLTKGRVITISVGASNAGTVTVANPTILPTTTERDVRFTIIFINAAGNAVTWAFGTAYKTSIPANTDGHTIIGEYLWDIASSKLRLLSLTDLAT